MAIVRARDDSCNNAMAHRDTSVSAHCSELGITPVTLYRYIWSQSPEDGDDGNLTLLARLLPLHRP